ncbi:MAG: folate-binding protein [Proteobacteria bacterium]|nr:MAG: folate-binding protein [Pseudomonadota bacterium]
MSEFVDFLKRDTSASFTDDRVAHFGNPEREIETALANVSKCPLLSLGVVSFTGTDARSFMNGQFTTDCTGIMPRHSQFSAWCDPKGRVLYIFTLYIDGDRLYAILPKAQIDSFMRRLNLYILRAEVELGNLSDALIVVGLSGTSSPDTTGLDEPWDTAQRPGATRIIRQGAGPPRFMIVGPDGSARERWAALEIPTVGEIAWKTLEIFGGVPRLDERTSGQFLPQQLNLDALNALSFSKGCYPGQEIIARLKYRGAVKKRLLIATVASPTEPVSGTPIQINGSGRTVGHVLIAQRLDAGRSALSAVVEVDATVADLHIEKSKGPALRGIDLPYAVD